MPSVGDELHQFGWNACSAALCPYAPHPHLERRYLIVPGLRSSRIHIVDTKPDPRSPQLARVIEADELARRAGYSRPHTSHCGPEGIYMSALGAPDGDGPGGVFLLDHENFDVLGQWEVERGPRVGDAEHGGGRAEAGAARPLRPPAPHLRPQAPPAPAGHRSRARAADGPRATPRARPEEAIWLRRRGRLERDLTASVWTWSRSNGSWDARKVIEIPPEPPDPGLLPPPLKPFGAVPPLITDLVLSLDDRFLYVSCWGIGELRQYGLPV